MEFAEQKAANLITVIWKEYQIPLQGIPGKLRPDVGG